MNAYYDFHVHSCLSPCADNDMTPNNIAGVGVLAGLSVMALTDHNSCKNCPGFFTAAKRYGIVPIAGMELTTAEDIHAVCLFETLEGAMAFDALVENRRMKIPNNTSVFGDQLIMDGEDSIIGAEPYYLHPASEFSVEELPALTARYGGVSYPAHIDREANGIIATLGTFPDIPGLRCAEFADKANVEAYTAKYAGLAGKRILVSSDAHNLWGVRDKDAFLAVNGAPGSDEQLRAEIFKVLRGEAAG